MSGVKKNFIYNVIYQILAICIPLITTPYASRVLGVDGIGIYSYTNSIAYYFMITAILGLNSYGSREIARCTKNKDELSYKFCSIYYMQMGISILVLLSYFVTIFFTSNYKIISCIQALYVLSSLFDINWFFYGIEKFKVTVTRNSMIKILSLILIFMFVKTENDVWIYTLILAGSTFISNFILLFFLRKHIKFVKVKIKDILINLKPAVILFIPVMAMKIYKVMDKSMIGILSNVSEVGYYSNADSIINVPMGVIIALGTVLLPRLSSMFHEGEREKAKELFKKALSFAVFIGVPIMFGLIGIAKDFSVVFLGSKFAKSGDIIQVLAITTLFMTIANVIRTQYLIPNNKDKEYTISVILGAVINVVCNLIFIRMYGAMGACVGTIMAEFIVMALHIYFVKNEIPIFKYLKDNFIFAVKGAIMFVLVYCIGKVDINIYVKLILQMCVGAGVYFILNIKYILNELKIKNIFKKLKKEKGEEKCQHI